MVMSTRIKLEFDSQELRSKLIASNITDKISGDYSISRAAPGIYSTQRGSFDITAEKFILSVCVWEGGVVEVEVHGTDGRIIESETLRETPIDAVIERIRELIEKATT